MHAFRRFGYGLVALSVLLVAGCGGGQKQNGEDKKAPQQILSDVSSAVTSASSVHVTGHVSTPGAGDVTLDLTMAGPSTGKGTVTVKGQTFQVVRINSDFYMKGPASAYGAFGVPATEASLIADRWIKAPATAAQFAQLAGFLGLSAIAQILQPSGTTRIGAKSKVRGTPVIALEDVVNGSVQGTAYISLVGKPYPLRVTGQAKTQASGNVDLTDWNKGASVSAPSGAFDVSQFLK
jgi:hypothetical protein